MLFTTTTARRRLSVTLSVIRKASQLRPLTKIFSVDQFSTKSVQIRTVMTDELKFVTQDEAIAIDQELFNDYRFSVDQLMELAGYSCAVAITKTYPLKSLTKDHGAVLICCGPGNNGGDGLVCARHLKLFGYRPSVLYPKVPRTELYERLHKQCTENQIPIVPYLPSDTKPITDCYNLIVDALFGFNFVPPVREPFIEIISKIKRSALPIVSIDVPSGWEVENGPPGDNLCLSPEMLISLSAPKLAARHFSGKYHYLGGRFIPELMDSKYHLNLPPYPDTDPVVRLKDGKYVPASPLEVGHKPRSRSLFFRY